MGNSHITKEICQKGAAASGKLQRERSIAAFIASGKSCEYCNKPLAVEEHQRASIRKNHRYCNLKCAALDRWRQKRDRENLPEPRKFEAWVNTLPFLRLGEIARQRVNYHARYVYFSRFPREVACCELCGDKRIEPDVAHVRAINDFPNKTPLIEINQLSNLIGLCPTDHRLFDSGKLDIAVIQETIEKRDPRPPLVLPKGVSKNWSPRRAGLDFQKKKKPKL
jgi:hypothetical protein